MPPKRTQTDSHPESPPLKATTRDVGPASPINEQIEQNPSTLLQPSATENRNEHQPEMHLNESLQYNEISLSTTLEITETNVQTRTQVLDIEEEDLESRLAYFKDLLCRQIDWKKGFKSMKLWKESAVKNFQNRMGIVRNVRGLPKM